ncbi:MAG TPA: DUF1778 domain-containing protein [Pirellulales bacterium]|nr:DUF1778 domain-containing protein [Pirellulales bacterium]
MSAAKKRPTGRPNTGRTEYLEVRMTPEEKERIATAAAAEGLSVSDFVRLTMRMVTSEATFSLVRGGQAPATVSAPRIIGRKEK